MSKKKLNLRDFLSEVEKRAYEIYTERTSENKHGSDMSDWFQAENDVKEKYNIME